MTSAKGMTLMSTRMRVKVVAPTGRRRLWRVVDKRGTWTCDSEEIARLVAARLENGQAPGWAAHDLRNGKKAPP